MIRKPLQICNKLGLHARAAAKFVHLASQFQSQITIAKDQEEVDGKSILGVLLLAAAQGSTVTVSARGADEELAVEALAGLVAGKFDEAE